MSLRNCYFNLEQSAGDPNAMSCTQLYLSYLINLRCYGLSTWVAPVVCAEKKVNISQMSLMVTKLKERFIFYGIQIGLCGRLQVSKFQIGTCGVSDAQVLTFRVRADSNS